MGADYYYWIKAATNPSGDDASVYSAYTIGSEGEPDIRVDPASVDIGSVPNGQSSHSSFTVHNDGDVNLVVSEAWGLDLPFQLFPANNEGDADDWHIAPGSSSEFVMTFAPSDLGDYSDTLTLNSNDPDEGS